MMICLNIIFEPKLYKWTFIKHILNTLYYSIRYRYKNYILVYIKVYQLLFNLSIRLKSFKPSKQFSIVPTG